MGQVLYITAPKEQPLKKLLELNLPQGQSAEALFASGALWLRNIRFKSLDQHVKKGQTVKVFLSDLQHREYVLPEGAVEIENDRFLAVWKSPGVATVSDMASLTNNLTYAVSQYLTSKGKPYQTMAISRLDFGVCGLVLFAKNKEMESKLFKLSQNRYMKKVYMAFVEKREGLPSRFRVKNKLGFVKRAVEDPEGKEAHSLFIKHSEGDHFVAYSVIIFTGRRHQIRSHAAQYLAPIVGDTMYGAKPISVKPAIALMAYGYNFRLMGQRYRLRISSPIQRLAGFLAI